MKKVFNKRKILIISIFIVIGLFIASFASATGLLSFGGRITLVQECTCGVGSLVTIKGFPWVFSGSYLYLPGVKKPKNKVNIILNKLIIGNYLPGGSCSIAGPESCYVLPAKGTITRNVGTN